MGTENQSLTALDFADSLIKLSAQAVFQQPANGLITVPVQGIGVSLAPTEVIITSRARQRLGGS